MDEFFSSKIWMKYFKWMRKQKPKRNVGRFGMVPNLHPRFGNLEKNEK
jgi:hypothetical protein